MIVTSPPDEASESLVCLGRAHGYSDELSCPPSLQSTRLGLSAPVNRIRMCPEVQPSIWPWVRHRDGEGARRSMDRNKGSDIYLGLAGYAGASVPVQLGRKETGRPVTVLIFYAISSLRSAI